MTLCAELLVPVPVSPSCLMYIQFSGSVLLAQRVLQCEITELDCCTQYQCCFPLMGVTRGCMAWHQRLRLCRAKLERDRSATKRLEKTYSYWRYITDQCRDRTLCGHVSSVVGCGNPTTFVEKRGVRASRLARNSTLGRLFRVLAWSGECGSVTRARLGQAILAVYVLVVECARRASYLFGST